MYPTYMGDIYKAVPPAIKRGSAELAVLSLLARESLHGYQIAKQIEQQTGGALRFDAASLYPVLYGMEKRGWVRGEWERAGGRRRRYYSITAEGRKKLEPLRAQWRDFFRALNRLAGVANA
jgi:PadR family transcriptional regulator, regulatory protein PadR